MANDGDIADVMLKTLFGFVGWVFKTLFKLIVWIFSGLFKLIASAFSKKKEKSSENLANDNASEEDDFHSFELSFKDAVQKVENAKAENSDNEQLRKSYSDLFLDTALSGKMNVDEKCKVLELLNKKLKDFYHGDVTSYFGFILDSISFSYRVLEELYEGDSSKVSASYDAFEAEVKKGPLRDANTYLMEILCFAGLLYSPDGNFSVEKTTLLKYDLPTFGI